MKSRTIKFLILMAIFSLVLTLSLTLGFNVFAAPQTEVAEEETEEFESAFAWLQNLDMSALRGYAAGLIAYLSGNILVIILMAIKLISAKSKEVKTSKFYEELMAKMDEEHKKQMQLLADNFTKELEGIEQSVTDEIKRQNSEKRIAAKETVDNMKKTLDNIGLELDK